MPRAKGENDRSVTVNIPSGWLPKIDAYAKTIIAPGMAITRSDAIRMLIAESLERHDERRRKR